MKKILFLGFLIQLSCFGFSQLLELDSVTNVTSGEIEIGDTFIHLHIPCGTEDQLSMYFERDVLYTLSCVENCDIIQPHSEAGFLSFWSYQYEYPAKEVYEVRNPEGEKLFDVFVSFDLADTITSISSYYPGKFIECSDFGSTLKQLSYGNYYGGENFTIDKDSLLIFKHLENEQFVDYSNWEDIPFSESDSVRVIRRNGTIFNKGCEVVQEVNKLEIVNVYVEQKHNVIDNEIQLKVDNQDMICPGDTALIEIVSGDGYYWYDALTGDGFKEYGGDTLIVTSPGRYVLSDEYLGSSGTNDVCPSISNFVEITEKLNCDGKVRGYVYSNGPYRLIPNLLVKADNGQVEMTDEDGYFEFKFDKENIVTLVEVANDNYFYSKSKVTYKNDFLLGGTGYSDGVSLYSYYIEQNDLGVSLQSGRNRPGFTIPYYVTVSNKSKNEQTSNVTVNLEDGLTYESLEDENTPNVISGQSLTWNGVTVASGETKRLKFYAELDRLTPLETELVSIASLSLTDDVEENNVDTLVAEVTGSYDPNDKLVNFTGMNTLGYVTDTTLFTYTVRFQNTGNDTAFTVRVEDIIDQDFDLSTIKVIDASHNYVMTIDNDTVNWTFNNILLVDSTTNEPVSHGFVRYQIAQKEGNEDGTVLTNKAWIYFDYNDPIITNETSNIVGNDQVLFLETQNKTSEISASLYPNPASSRITVSESGFFSVYNVLGDQVYRSEIERDGVINIEDWISGVYYFELKNEEGYKQGSFVKE